jgi:hypothetical protein
MAVEATPALSCASSNANESVEFVPNRLSDALIGVFRAIGGRIVGFAETSYSQWQQ